MGFSSGNPIIKHNGMEAEVILASQGPEQKPIYTLRGRVWLQLWAEILTHRVFGRNARSSRAVPFKTLLAELRSGAGFIPDHWTANEPGMQGADGHNAPVIVAGDSEYPNSDLIFDREEAWQEACDSAISYAEAFANAGYHKQLANRLVAPFLMIDFVITSTDWENFFWLRKHGAAEPHLQDFARIVSEAIEGATIQQLQPGEWHLPYITDEDRHVILTGDGCVTFHRAGIGGQEALRRLSAARCARVSYAPFDGDASYEKELERYNLLVSSDRVHASPLEHQATPDESTETPIHSYLRDAVIGTAGRGLPQLPKGVVRIWDKAHLHGNLTGYIQARKLVPNEAYHG